MELFTLLGKIAVDVADSDKIMDTIADKAQGVGSKLETAGSKLSGWGSTMTKTVTVAGTAIGGMAIKSAMTYEDAMAKIDTIANLTAENAEISYGDMEKAILNLSNQTGISASAIAEDVYNAISAGQSVGDAVNFVTNSSKLAKAGFAESGQALDVLTTIMNAYGLEAEEVTKVSDILIQTQNLGKTTVGDLSSTMGRVIPTAKSYNVSLEQVASGYTIMTAKGIATVETTTYMNSMLNELGKNGTKVSDVLKAKTGKSFNDLMTEGYTLGDCLEIVNDAAVEQNLSFMDMWGSAEAAKAGVTLLGDGATVFNGRLEEMQASTGSTDAAFEKLDTTSLKLTKAINQAKNILIDLGGTIIELLLPYLEKGAAALEKFASWFGNLDEGTQKLIVTLGGIAIVAGPVMAIIGKVTTGVGGLISIGSKLIGGIGGVSTATTGIIGIGGKLLGGIGGIVAKIGGVLLPAIGSIGAPVLGVIGVAGGLVAAGVAIYKNWDTIKETAGKVWNAVTDTIGGAAKAVGGFFKDMWQTGVDNWKKVFSDVSTIAGNLKDKVVGFAQEQSSKIKDTYEKFGSAVSGIWDKVKTKVSDTAENLKEKVVGFAQEQSSKIKDTYEKFGSAVSGIWDNVKTKVSDTAENLKDKVVTFAQEQSEKIQDNWSAFKDKTLEIWGNIKDSVSQKASEIKETTTTKMAELKENASAAWEGIKEKASGAWDNIKSTTSSAWDTISSTVSSAAENAKNGAVNAFSNLSSGVSNACSNVWSAVQNGFGSAVDFIKGLGSKAWEWGSDFISGFVDGIKSMFGKVKDAVSGVANMITSWLHFSVPDEGPLTEYESWMPDFMAGLAKGINDNKKLVTKAVHGLAEDMVLPDMQQAYAYSVSVNPLSAARQIKKEYPSALTAGSTEGMLLSAIRQLNQTLQQLPQMQVVLDTGQTIGALAEPMSSQLSKIVRDKERGV